MRAAVPTNQQPQPGAPPNQVAQGGQAPPQGPILRLSNPGANPQLRSLLLSQQQPVRIKVEAGFPRRLKVLISCLHLLQQGGVSHMQGMMPHQGLGQQMVHPTPGGGAQMQGQWRQPLGGQETPPRSEVEELTLQFNRNQKIQQREENQHSSYKLLKSEMLWMRTLIRSFSD